MGFLDARPAFHVLCFVELANSSGDALGASKELTRTDSANVAARNYTLAGSYVIEGGLRAMANATGSGTITGSCTSSFTSNVANCIANWDGTIGSG